MRSHVRKLLRLWTFKVCIRISFETSFFFKMLLTLRLLKWEKRMKVLRNHPLPTQMPTHGLVKILGSWAEISNSSTPNKRHLPCRETSVRWGRQNNFIWSKLFAALNPSFHLHSKSGPLFRCKTVKKAAPMEDMCKGNPSLLDPGMYSIRDRINRQIHYLSHWFTPTVKAEGKAAGAWCSSITDLGSYSSLTWASAWAREHLRKMLYLQLGFLP